MQKQFEDLAIFPGSELELIRHFMNNEGVRDEKWLLGTGLTSEALRSVDNTISLRQFDIIYRNVYRMAQRPGLGIDFGLALNISRWGMLSSALLCASTLAHALSIANEFREILRSRFSMENEVKNGYLEVTLIHQPEMAFPVNEVFGHEVFLGTLKTQISQLTAKSFRFHEIKLPYPKPAQDQGYQKLADNIQFGASHAQLSIPIKLLQQTLPMRNRVTREVVLSYCRDELDRVRNARSGDIVFTVTSLLSQYGAEIPELDEVASKLSMSARTLRRKLQQTNTTYRALCEHQRQQLAMSMLSSPELTVQEIAQRCGFKDNASFHKAFKRWTGETPAQYRKILH